MKRRAAHYLKVAARYIEDPQQIQMRRPFFLPKMYMALNKPWLHQLEIRTILDIGASVGGFAFTVRPLFPEAMIYAFEPLPNAYAALERNLAGIDRLKALNIGIGDVDAELTMHESVQSDSSSFLEMGERHRHAFPDTAKRAQEIPVRVARLDGLVGVEIHEPVFAKIDVQGYELHVLRGGEQTFRRAQVVLVETSFQPLYQGGPLFADVFRVLTDWGFAYHGGLDSLESPATGSPLQEDSLFIRQA